MTRINLRLESINEAPLSGWQLQDFINTINKSYTKIDLINEIAHLLSKGVNPMDIVIINKSYDINNQYKYLRTNREINLDNPNLVEKLYHLGSPFSMFPNEKVIKMNLFFRLYKKIYRLFKSNNISPLSKWILRECICGDFNDALNIVLNGCNSLIPEGSEYKGVKSKVEKYVEDTGNKYRLFLEDRSKIEKIMAILKDKDSLDNLADSDLNKIVDKYFYEFFNLFNKVERPIIFVFNQSENKMSLIRGEYMLNDTSSENFLDFKSYSHNSPFIITFSAGIIILALIKQAYVYYEQDTLNNKKERELEENFKSRIDNLFPEFSETNKYNYIKDIDNVFIKENLSNIQENVQRANTNAFKQKGVINHKMQIEKCDDSDNLQEKQ